MNAWREIVADKLSKLLADSPSHHPSNVSPSDPKVILHDKDESPSSGTSYSSYVRTVLQKASSSINRGISSELRGSDDINSSPLPSVHNGRNNLSVSSKDSLVCNQVGTESRSNGHGPVGKENPGLIPQQKMDASIIPKEHGSNNSEEFTVLLHNSTLISLDLFEFLQASLPNTVRGSQWVLIYSSVKHGISLRTLLRRSSNFQGPCVLILGDKQGTVFGGLLDGAPKPTAKRKYQGTNQMFVFTTLYGEPRIFRATGTITCV